MLKLILLHTIFSTDFNAKYIMCWSIFFSIVSNYATLIIITLQQFVTSWSILLLCILLSYMTQKEKKYTMCKWLGCCKMWFKTINLKNLRRELKQRSKCTSRITKEKIVSFLASKLRKTQEIFQPAQLKL